MKSILKSAIAFWIAAAVLVSGMNLMLGVSADTGFTTDISWYGGQNGNPWDGSNWTFLTGKDGSFSGMEYYISEDSETAEGKPGWAADESAETAYIGTWRQQATAENWAVTAFCREEDGNVTGTSTQTLQTNGSGAGEVIVVLKNDEGFYPVWPAAGAWQWQTVSDETGITVSFETGYQAGDTLYYIVKPADGQSVTRITICPAVTIESGVPANYPEEFRNWNESEPEVFVTDISWYGGQNGNPYQGSPWTFFTGTDGDFEIMENYIPNDSETASLKPGWATNAETGGAFITTWRQQATEEEWAVTAFDLEMDGNITGTSGQTLQTNGSGAGNVMVVLKNEQGFYPVWPVAGKWKWQTISNEDGIEMSFETGYQAGDTLYYIVKPAAGEEQTRITICPALTFESGTPEQYPEEFSNWNDFEPEVYTTDISWFGNENGNPYDGSAWTFLTGRNGDFSKMGNYISSDSEAAEVKPGWAADENAETAYIGSWRQQATFSKWAVTAFEMDQTGNIAGGSGVSLKTNGSGVGDVIVALGNRQGFYPVWPVEGEWVWQTVSDEDGLQMSFETGYQAGDTLYYIVKPGGTDYQTRLEIQPSVTLTTGSPQNYPSSATFTAWNGGEEENVIACVGDSITFGIGATDRGTDSYPAVLQRLLGDSKTVINFGSSGATMTSNTGGGYTERPVYAASLESNADTVLLMMGTNDCRQQAWEAGVVTAEKFKASAKALIAAYEALPSHPEVILMNFAAIYDDPERPVQNQNILLNALEEVAAETGCRLIDVRSFTSFHPEYFSDTLHPNTTGYAKLAQFVYDKMTLPFYGDVNADHKVNILDLALLKRYFADHSVVIEESAADLNGSGDVDTADPVLLKKLLLTGGTDEETERFYGVCYCAYEAQTWYGRDTATEIDAMTDLGAKTFRLWLCSDYIMSDPETFKDNETQVMKGIIQKAHKNGLQVIGMNHRWFSGGSDHMAVPARDLTPGSDYETFLLNFEEMWYQLAEKFPEITVWEIGNEWNNNTFLHPLSYKTDGAVFTFDEKADITTDMLYYASAGIHRANPQAKTVLGGLVDVYGTGFGNAKDFLERIYGNITGGNWPSTDPERYFQIAAWHPYHFSGAPDAAWVDRQEEIYNLIREYEGREKTVLFTELGLSDYGNAETDAAQGEALKTTLSMIHDELPFVKSVYWFRMFDEANAASWGGEMETGFGLFTEPDGNGAFSIKEKGKAYAETAGGESDFSRYE